MKKLMFKIIISCLLVVALIGTIVFANNYAQTYEEIYSQDFSSVSGSLDNSYYTQGSNRVTAEVVDGKLSVKNDAVAYFAVNSAIDNVTVVKESQLNKHGIEMCYNTDCYVYPMESPLTYQGKEYGYMCAVGGNGAVYFEEIAGVKAIKQFTYAATISNNAITAIRTNASRFKVDPAMFSAGDDAIVEVRYYTPSGDKKNGKIKLFYPKNGDNDNSFTGYKEYVISESNAGEWKTARFDIPGINFGKYHETSNTANTHNLRIESEQDKELYIHSVSVYKKKGTVSGEATVNGGVIKQFTERLLYGNYKFSFDVLVPTDRLYDDSVNALTNNAGESVYQFSVLNHNQNEIISLEYDLGEEITISALTADGKEELYSGDIYDAVLSHEITYDMETNTYQIGIAMDDTTIVEPGNTYSILGDTADFLNFQYFKVGSAIKSGAAEVVIDNLKAEIQENLIFQYSAEDLESINLEIRNPVNRSFELPVVGTVHSSEITWISSNEEAIQIVGNRAIVTCTESEVEVTLTPQITVGSLTMTGPEYYVVVASIANTYADVTNLNDAVNVTTNIDGTLNAYLEVSNCGPIAGQEVYFIAVSKNPTTQKITDKQVDSVLITRNYQRAEFNINNLRKDAGDIVEYYLWNQDGVSLINNAPTAVSDLKVTSKVTGVKVEWEQSYDDNGNDAIQHYEIYRDGSFVGTTNETSYLDTTVEDGISYSYSVLAKDTNDNESDMSNSLSGQTIEMYYANVDCPDDEVADNSNGLNLLINSSESTVAYSAYDSTMEARYTPRLVPGKTYDSYMMFATDKQKVLDENAVTSEYSDIVIRITYLDNQTGNLKVYYNAILPEGTEDSELYYKAGPETVVMTGDGMWKTAVIYLDDAQFRNPSRFSGADFAIGCTNGDKLYIKKVEVIQTERYE